MKKGTRPDMRPIRQKTLDELEGVVAGMPPHDSYLVSTIYALRRKPIGDFTTEDLRITIGQGRGIPYLLPLALERLEEDPLAQGHLYRGDLLMSVLRAEPHWGGKMETRSCVRRLVERALEHLEGIEPTIWLDLPDPERPDETDREQLEPRLRSALQLLARTAV